MAMSVGALALLFVSQVSAQKSLDEIDRMSFEAGPSPLERNGFEMTETGSSVAGSFGGNRFMSLSGEWTLAADGVGGKPDWETAVPAEVPGSVHSALFRAGRIPDPMVGRNDSVAEKCSYKRWWLRKSFECGEDWKNPELKFKGVANRCRVWLNGHFLGAHEGMFGGPYFEVGGVLQKGGNELLVLLDSIPQVYCGGWPATANEAWKHTVAVNCVYGWHYAKIPSLGIWQDVVLEERPAAGLENAFVATKTLDGEMRLSVGLRTEPGMSGQVRLHVEPYNFEGGSRSYEWSFKNRSGDVALDFKIDSPRLWYPNGMGEQCLYQATADLVADGRVIDREKVVFGVRTVEMKPLPDGPKEDKYNWTFVINGKPMFVKGAGWCTMDALLDFSRDRYSRFLTVARDQHIQMLRAWGGGLPETDEFYSLCDELGIMVMQEWPTAWNSHQTQPYEMLEETVVRNTLRLRNHPSLVMWGAGNESEDPYGKAIDMMGKAGIELDGTRPFHRGEAWGGSRHNYNCWWDNLHLNHNLNMVADFWGEFGIPSLPVKEHVERYLDGEPYRWPADKAGNFAHHTPIFGTNGELERLEQYSGYFMPDSTLECMVLGSQLAQVEGVRHTLERARTRWPYCTGALYYKLNDNYPGLSWSSVDYYGGIKPLHYFVKRSFAPIAPVLLFDRTNMTSQDVSLPLYLLDDNDSLRGRNVKVEVSVYNQRLQCVYDSVFSVVPADKVEYVGKVSLNSEQTDAVMLYYKADVKDETGRILARNWYFSNYETKPGCLLEAKKCRLEYMQEGNTVVLKNKDSVPAIGVTLEVPRHASSVMFSDNYIWLDAKEEMRIEMNSQEQVKVKGWNIDMINN